MKNMSMVRKLLAGEPLTGKRFRSSALWENITTAAPDPILGITEDYTSDPNHRKINLSVGAYRDEAGAPIILKSIKMASVKLFEHQTHKEYTAINGSATFRNCVRDFLYGSIDTGAKLIKEDRISITQSLSGTGALRLAGEFWKKWNPSSSTSSSSSNLIYMPNPTWSNHLGIFRDAGIEPVYYTYFNRETNSINFPLLIQDLQKAEPGSLVLLHACCHNPSGLDPSKAQWREILEVVVNRHLVPVVDIAYQGFVTGNLLDDLWLLEAVLQKVDHNEIPTALICQSFAKNMGLYGERVGSLSIITPAPEKTRAVDSQLKKIIRAMYSSPSIHGSELVEIVLTDPVIRQQWEKDVFEMANRIKQMRQDLHDALSAESHLCWDHLIQQNGMFCFTGLTKDQIIKLRDDFSIYATLDGRISISGINKSNVKYLSEAILQVTKKK